MKKVFRHFGAGQQVNEIVRVQVIDNVIIERYDLLNFRAHYSNLSAVRIDNGFLRVVPATVQRRLGVKFYQ